MCDELIISQSLRRMVCLIVFIINLSVAGFNFITYFLFIPFYPNIHTKKCELKVRIFIKHSNYLYFIRFLLENTNSSRGKYIKGLNEPPPPPPPPPNDDRLDLKAG